MKHARLAAIVLGLALCWRPAAADILTYNFTATVVDQTDLGLSVGDLVTGSFSYDTAATDFNVGNPLIGAYFQGQTLQFAVGAISATAPLDAIVVENGDPDELRAGSINVTSWEIGLVLADHDQTVFTSDALPAPLPDLGEFEDREFSARLLDGTDLLGSFEAQITSLTLVTVTEVPEPSTLAMLGGSLLAGALAAGRRRRASSVAAA